jgi:uncharacterized membrane protein YfcA
MDTAALMAVVALAACAEAIAGFGGTVLTVALGTQLLPLGALLAAWVPVNLLLSTWLVVRHRRHLDKTLLLRGILPLVAIGMALGLLLYRLEPGRLLLLGFAGFVALLAVTELGRIALRTSSPPPGPWQIRLALLAGGVVHGLYGSGGPLIVYATSRTGRDKATFRVTLSALWLVLGLVLTVNFALLGLLTPRSLVLSAWLLVPLVGAVLIGERLHRHVPEAPFRILVHALLLVAAASLLWRTWQESPT